MTDRRLRILFGLATALVALAQAVVTFYVRGDAGSGIEQLGRLALGGTLAAGLFGCAFVLAVCAWWRAERTRGGVWLAWLMVSIAIAAPAANWLHLAWWPSDARLVRAAASGGIFPASTSASRSSRIAATRG